MHGIVSRFGNAPLFRPDRNRIVVRLASISGVIVDGMGMRRRDVVGIEADFQGKGKGGDLVVTRSSYVRVDQGR